MDRIAAIPQFAEDQEICHQEANAAVNAIYSYGKAGAAGDARAFAHLERWEERLDRIAAIPQFAEDQKIRLQEAKAAVNAILCYGKAGAAGDRQAFANLERWGERLDRLAAIPQFAEDQEIRLQEAKAAVNAISYYGKAGGAGDAKAFAHLERWEERLDRIAAIPQFAEDQKIHLEEAKAAVNAINGYGEAGAAGDARAFAHLERWSQRLDRLAAIPQFAEDQEIRQHEARAAVSAIFFYGRAGAAGDVQAFGHFKRWEERLDRLVAIPQFAEDQEIRQHEAKAAVNAIIYYGKAGKAGFGDERRWRRRLALLVQQFRHNGEISYHANGVNLSYLDQEKRNWPEGTWKRPDNA